MYGLMVFGALGLYLLISIGVVLWAIRYARKRGKSTKLWGWVAAFVMYNLLFWDWLPTVVAHKYLCATQSGFWVYKTLDQWKAENPGMLERLVANGGAPSRTERFDNGHGEKRTYYLNDRFNWIVTQQDVFWFLRIIRTEEQVKDVKKDEVLARYIGFGTGHSVKHPGGDFPGVLKLWVVDNHCAKDGKNRDALRNFSDPFHGRRK